MRAPSDTEEVSTDLSALYAHVRSTTEALAEPLSIEDQAVQSMPDVSPTKWHRAHITWFFETFLLLPFARGYQRVEEYYAYVFNSYYEAVGERHRRPDRGLITRPTNDQVTEYRARVDEAMLSFMASDVGQAPEVVELIALGLHHEQQHQELLLMDAKHVLSRNPSAPAYDPRPVPDAAPIPSLDWCVHPGGLVEVGHTGHGFAFDNEGPRHEALIQPHRLADRLVTNGEWLEFTAAGGYDDVSLWLSAGRHTNRANGWDAPMYWSRSDDGWLVHTLTGSRPVDPGEPVPPVVRCMATFSPTTSYTRFGRAGVVGLVSCSATSGNGRRAPMRRTRVS